MDLQPTQHPLQVNQQFPPSESPAPVEEEKLSPPSEPEEGGEELDLDGIVSDLSEGEEEVKEEGGEVEDPTTKPEFAKLAEDFKAALGVDLKEAMDAFNATKAEMQAMQQRIQEMEAQRTLSDLQDAWDVTPKELDRRVDAVLKVFNKMTDAQKEKYNSMEGVQRIWASIEGKKSKAAPSSGGQKPATPVKRYKQSEIRDMMLNNPQLYDQNQAMLEEAFKQGLVDND